MVARILKSEIDAAGIVDFQKAVDLHRSEVADWRAHMKRVEDDSKLPLIQPPIFSEFSHLKDAVPKHREALDIWRSNMATRHVPYPAPHAHPLVDKALNEGFQIVDDSPTPDQILVAKKRLLIEKLTQAEAAVISSIFPIGKQRANAIRQADILAKEKKYIEALPEETRKDPAKFTVAVDKIRKARSPDDAAHMNIMEVQSVQADSLYRAGAKIMSNIEDLTADNIDAWRMPNLESPK